MLPFGSLAPVIFLPVLAFAYMLYFIAGAFNNGFKSDEKRLPDLSLEKKLVITVKSDVTGNHTCCFYRHKSPKHEVIKSKSVIPKSYEQSVYRIIKIPDTQIIFGFQRFSLFSRPPPFSA